MSTVDLTKVAGFKAVDAEGNDMGVVSLSEMTNMVKESIIQEAVAMQSVSTLAEASTLAATDTYEDKLDISDTFSYVRTLDSSGNPKRTSQNALATVVGGLIELNKKSLTRLEQTISASEILQTGIKNSAAVLVTTNTYNKAIVLILFSPADTTPNIAFNTTSAFGTNESSTFYVYIEDGELRIKNNHTGSTIFRIVNIQILI